MLSDRKTSEVGNGACRKYTWSNERSDTHTTQGRATTDANSGTGERGKRRCVDIGPHLPHVGDQLLQLLGQQDQLVAVRPHDIAG